MATTQELETIEHHIAFGYVVGDGTRRSSVWDPATGQPQAESRWARGGCGLRGPSCAGHL